MFGDLVIVFISILLTGFICFWIVSFILYLIYPKQSLIGDLILFFKERKKSKKEGAN